MNPNQDISKKSQGDIGESEAAAYLEANGYELLKRNFHFGRTGEIDIIARQGASLVFVEVKARTNSSYGDPLFSITPSKQQKIRTVARGYLYVNKIEDTECRFDVITVVKLNGKTKIEHIENAF